MARTSRRKPAHAPQERVEDLDKAQADFINKYSRQENTISKYQGELRRAQEYVDSRADFLAKNPSSNTKGYKPDDVRASLRSNPNHLSVTMLKEYTSERCINQGCGYSTAAGIQGAFSWLWKNSGDGYSGAYIYREDIGVCGNPTAAESFKELIHALARREKETVRNHAEAFTYPDTIQLFAWSFSAFSEEELRDFLKKLPQDNVSLAFVLLHARIRAIVSLCWTLWLRIGELINLQWKNFEFTVGKNGRPCMVVHVINRKNSNNGNPDLQDTTYKLYEGDDKPEALQAYKHVKQYIELIQAYSGKFTENDYVFCSIRRHTIYKNKRTCYTSMLEFVRKITKDAGLEADYTTHCFRRGGAAWRFIHAPPEFLWGLIRCQLWGGWKQGERIGTMLKYIVDERERVRGKEDDVLDLDPDRDKPPPYANSNSTACSCGGGGGGQGGGGEESFSELKALIIEMQEHMSQMLIAMKVPAADDFKATMLEMEEHLTQRILKAIKAPEEDGGGDKDPDFECCTTTNVTADHTHPDMCSSSQLASPAPTLHPSHNEGSITLNQQSRLPTPTHTHPSLMYPVHSTLNPPAATTTHASSSSSPFINQHIHHPTPTYTAAMYPMPPPMATTATPSASSSSQPMAMWPSYFPDVSVPHPTLNTPTPSFSSSNPPHAMWPSYPPHSGLAWPWPVPNQTFVHPSTVSPSLPLASEPPSSAGLSRSISRSYNSQSFQPGINLSTNPPHYDENNVPPMALRKAAFPHTTSIKAAIHQWTRVDALLQRAPKDWPKSWYAGTANAAGVGQTRTNRKHVFDSFQRFNILLASTSTTVHSQSKLDSSDLPAYIRQEEGKGRDLGRRTEKEIQTARLVSINMAHFVIEEQLFTKIQGSPCRPIPSTLPSKISHEPERGIDLQSLLDITWVSHKFPFLMAVPVQNPFYAPLFDRLDYRKDQFPVVSNGKGFRLRHRTMTEWEDLELNLKAVIYAMSEICLIHLPQSFRFWASPRRYGHTRLHKSMEIAQSVALQSRNSFIPFIAAATFYLTLMNTQFTHPPIGSTWRQAILSRTGVHHQWLSELELSVAGDLSLERVGAIFDPNQFPSLLPSLSEINMPILICWGPVSNPLIHGASDYLRKSQLVPTIDELKLLQSGKPLPHSSLLHPNFPSPLPRLPSSSLPPPAAEPSCDWKEFFLRRQMANELTLQTESSVDRQARESRANHALRQQVPGKKGAQVFIWEDVDGNRIRKPVGRRHVEDIWLAYGSQQRIYDAFRDQWDLCTDFGDGSDIDDEDDSQFVHEDDHVNEHEYEVIQSQSVHEDHHRNEYDSQAQSVHHEDDHGNETTRIKLSPPVDCPSSAELLPAEPFHLPVGPQSSIEDLERNHGLGSEGEAQLYSFSFPDAAEDRSYHWYGIITTPHPDFPTPVDMKITWSACREYLGNGRWLESPDVVAPAPLPPTSTQVSMCIFFHKLLTSQKIDDVPDALYDLRTQHPDEHLLVRIRAEIMEGVTHFFIRPQESKRPEYDVSWEVMLTSAAATLGILRRPDLDFVGIVHYLLDRGISFKTCIIGPSHPPPFPDPYRHSGLGYRPPQYHPDMVDYGVYLSRRNELLRGPRGRAALLMGGIISRLAREVVQYQHVLDGPTDNVFETGMMLRSQTGVGYWDDTLTEHEIHIICGVYKVDTGRELCRLQIIIPLTQPPAQPMKATQTADLSWWPKPSAWDSAGINLGFWSEDCERWFQGHLKKLKDGKFLLRSTTSWKSALRFNKDTPKVTLKNEQRAAEYLAKCDL
ncbi:hypothetical protein H0H93_007999 [Arthromyces matolae]|nr:hypothetical protein H0H93_007999 [Arthromyces matolae]